MAFAATPVAADLNWMVDTPRSRASLAAAGVLREAMFCRVKREGREIERGGDGSKAKRERERVGRALNRKLLDGNYYLRQKISRRRTLGAAGTRRVGIMVVLMVCCLLSTVYFTQAISRSRMNTFADVYYRQSHPPHSRHSPYSIYPREAQGHS